MSQENSEVRTAQCSCGALVARVSGDPLRVSICHCHACQRRTGSVFGAQARFANTDVSLSGDFRTYTRTADSGNAINFYFCPECGSTVAYSLRSDPEVIAIPVGGFADASFLPKPAYSVYEERMHPWVEIPEGTDRFA